MSKYTTIDNINQLAGYHGNHDIVYLSNEFLQWFWKLEEETPEKQIADKILDRFQNKYQETRKTQHPDTEDVVIEFEKKKQSHGTCSK